MAEHIDNHATLQYQNKLCKLYIHYLDPHSAFIFVALDTHQLEWLLRQFKAGIDIKDMWWLGDCQYGSTELPDPVTSNFELLCSLEETLHNRTIFDRVFKIERVSKKITSYKFRLPAMPIPQDSYFKKSVLLRYMLDHTSLKSFMQANDVIDPAHAEESVLNAVEGYQPNRFSDGYPLDTAKAPTLSSLGRILNRRRSRKSYSSKTMPYSTLSVLLSMSAGITKWVKTKSDRDIPFYSYPMGGGIKSTYLFMYCNSVEGIEPNYYYYDALGESIKVVGSDIPFLDLCNATAYASALKQSSVTFFIVGDYYLKSLKYLDRAYRVVLSESGHLSQNLHLVAEDLELKSCVLMGFSDELFSKALNLNADRQSVISLLTVGY